MTPPRFRRGQPLPDPRDDPQDSMPAEGEVAAGVRDKKVIEIQVPLALLLPVAIAVCWALIGMYFQLGQLAQDRTELQVVTKSLDNRLNTVQSKTELIEFRVRNLETK